MPNPFGAPEISTRDVDAKVKSGQKFVWLDVREPYEFASAAIANTNISRVPISRLAQEGPDALPTEAQDKNTEIVVSCHHGGRSAQVVAWLRQQGWTNVLNMDGGIDAWAREVDPSVGRY
ncbi:MAG: rhodanese-like domain-containing protein [Caldilineaceae bacterium]